MTDEEISYLADILFKISEKDAVRACFGSSVKGY